MKRDYYKVTLPSDLCSDDEHWMQTMGQHAIEEARERAKLFVIPCEWQARLVKRGDWESTFSVRRTRNG